MSHNTTCDSDTCTAISHIKSSTDTRSNSKLSMLLYQLHTLCQYLHTCCIRYDLDLEAWSGDWSVSDKCQIKFISVTNEKVHCQPISLSTVPLKAGKAFVELHMFISACCNIEVYYIDDQLIMWLTDHSQLVRNQIRSYLPLPGRTTQTWFSVG